MSGPEHIPIHAAEVRIHNGRPALFVNCEPHDGLTYMTYNPKAENFARFDEIGVRVMSFTLTSDSNFWPQWCAPVCPEPGIHDYTDFDARIEAVVEAAPHAWLLPRVYSVAPEWWCRENPQEMTVYGEPRAQPRPDVDTYNGRLVPSMASKAWRAFACANMRRMVEHIQEQPYADRFLGIHYSSGISEEWVQWGSHEGFFPDYSAAMLAAFREFLRERYGSDDALREAWGRPDVTLATAAVPTLEERVRQRHGRLFRDPGEEQNVVDYLLCLSYEVVDTMCALAAAIKEAWREPRITLAFTGSYLCDQNWQQYLTHNGGALGLERLLACPHLDALSSPSTYAHRGPGTGHSSFMTLGASVALAGKLWFDENDCRTHLPSERQPGFGATHSVGDTICTQRRQFAAVLEQGCTMWWFDMGGNWYDAPVHEEVRRSVRIARRALATDRSSAAEIALVVDSRSLAYVAGATSWFYTLLNCPKRNFGRGGAPYDLLALSDLPRAREYKLYVFLNAFHLTEGERRMIDSVVKRDGKTAWWFLAPGYIADACDAEHMTQLTGFRFGLYGGHARPDTEVRPGEHPVVVGLDRTRLYGSDCVLMAPFFYVDDPGAVPLGVWHYDEHLPLLAAKDMGEWRSLHSTAPNPPSWLVRRVARWAGVHVYNERDEALYANESILTVSTNRDAGLRTLRLPRRTAVYELFDDKREWTDVTELTVDLPRHHTSVFFLGTRKAWEER